ncbi:MAG: glycosyltransferase WbuB [Aequorivita sp.]|nr:glycosyltransferase WbuB [Aequorivita sp.]|tara:strand:+ start:17918 stop:19093 length:1176 start_codon:yes stop_codon:yes gene_type:complete
MKKILYLTFYFEPDLCAGSFRNSPLIKELAKQAKSEATIDVITTLPNRYSSFVADASKYEQRDNYTVRRVVIPMHQSGMKDQMLSFKTYYTAVKKHTKGKQYDLVVASSSRLFTAFLGYRIASKFNAPLYLDIRDIFYDTMKDVLQNKALKTLALPVIKKVENKTFGYASHINLISGGFKPYFDTYKKPNYTYFPNGIDDIFIVANKNRSENLDRPEIKTIVYAGNVGEGQGLHKIIPQAAKALEGRFNFLIIGDGGAKQNLIDKIKEFDVYNVELRSPVKRNELIALYKQADFLFAHLNNYTAFEKVLPSKLFELATFSKPLIAGIGGFSANFVRKNIENSILFEPCNVNQFVEKLTTYKYKEVYRENFIEKYKRSEVNKNMAQTMLNYL